MLFRSTELAERFAPLAEKLAADQEKILEELTVVQGNPVDLGGYYQPEAEKIKSAMRPSATLNAHLDSAFA